MTDSHATRITPADGYAVTIVSRSEPVTDWAVRYFGAWWSASRVDAADVPGPVVVADVDPDVVTSLTDRVTSGQHTEAVYANDRMLCAADTDGTVEAVQPDAGLAYRWEPSQRRLTIAGTDTTAVATAAARLGREVLRGQLLGDGWQILHASAVTDPDGRAVLTLGDKGAGKTTVGFLLARAGWHLLANDRVFVRVEDGAVRVLPWPAAAAIGFGLLDAMGLYDVVRDRLLAGEQMHPTQHQRVTDALLANDREPLWKPSGKELKPQFFPDQLDTWLGMKLATEGRAGALLFPRITPGAAPVLSDDRRGVQEGDFFSATTEDRYPDVFRLLPVGGPSQRLADSLAALPHQSLILGHDTASNTALLKEVTASLL
ncbi:hypothetical protein [Streptomyces sp. CB03238]|uniref:hypothetical protein n=1 Tax=Streptomyces sp. CB03238 TaxID=1907777 RepID=UPI000A115446|nr:hypothetical protein [Streptomyces sp. CB03238]ORT54207.1 hypothetical protein BKD26_36055 [Streptomyces sp. CB03238]